MKSAKLRAAARLTFFVAFCGSQSQMVSTCEGVDSWNAREKTFRASYMNPSTGGVFGANFTGIVRKYWIIDATPTRCLTAFKTENPDARKKTKLDHRSYHFSFLPSSFHTIDSSATIKSHPGILQQSHDSLENWYARSGASVTWESTWTMKRATSCLRCDF